MQNTSDVLDVPVDLLLTFVSIFIFLGYVSQRFKDIQIVDEETGSPFTSKNDIFVLGRRYVKVAIVGGYPRSVESGRLKRGVLFLGLTYCKTC